MKIRKILPVISILLILSIMTMAVPAVPVAAVGSLSLSQPVGTVGSTISISGSGFTGTIITNIDFNIFTPVLISPAAIAGGAFSTFFVVPPLPGGVYTITVRSDVPADTANINFIIMPEISINKSSGEVNTQVLFNGSGFPGSGVALLFFNDVQVASVPTTHQGIFNNLVFNIPETRAGAHTFRGFDGIRFTSPVNFSISPTINIDQAAAVSGGQISLSGRGFAASSPMTFLFNNLPVAASVMTNPAGSFSATLTIPAVSGGEHILRITDGAGNFKTATITTSSTFSLSSTSGPVGSQVTLTGAGFAPQRALNVSWGGQALPGNQVISTDTAGNFRAVVSVPVMASGTYTVHVTDGLSSGSAKFTSSGVSRMESSASGKVGSNIVISVQGYRANEAISILFGNSVLGSATTDAAGSFRASLAIPPAAAGSHEISGTDGINQFSYRVTVVPETFQPSLLAGFIGAETTISGTGFAAGTTLSALFNNVPISTTVTDNKGNFSLKIKIPAAKSGNHTLAVTDGVIINNYTFTIQSSAPETPDLNSPPKESRPVQPVTFHWGQVTSQNGPVLYQFQLARDINFLAVLIERKDLSGTFITLTAQEELDPVDAKNPYYWRIRAIDAAGDSSEWSTASAFFVGALEPVSVVPTWLYYVVIGLGGLLLFCIGFLLGRKARPFGIYR
ncbi:MAG TPA: hypothetical protein VLH15_06345 [Dehalococcoidales bacterium]|nr:hypothetical protein [Dehalococcoidales bacterium]